MFGWLAKKGENSRVYMCTKELQWDLERADGKKRAAVLALAQYLRATVLAEIGHTPLDMIDLPYRHSRDDLIYLYGMLENLRNQTNAQLAQNQKGMKRLGMELPAFVEERVRLSNRGIEVWMVTLGCGITPEYRDNVAEIWRMLSLARVDLDRAMAWLYETEERSAAMLGQPAEGFALLDREDWIAACDFVPEMIGPR